MTANRTANRYLRETPPPMSYEAARNMGLYPGIQGDVKFGANFAINGAGDIWISRGDRNTPTASFSPFIASDNAGDTSDITLRFLDENGYPAETTVTLNGQTPVDVGITMTKCTRGFIADGIQAAVNGTVSLASANNFTGGVPDNPTEILWQFAGSEGQTLLAADRVPAGHNIIITDINCGLTRNAGTAASARLGLFTRSPGSQWRGRQIFELSNASQRRLCQNLVLPPGTDIKGRVLTTSTTVAIDFSWIYDRVEL